MIKAIVGLGNPGIKYKNTRHNLGFDFLDILSKNQISNWKSNFYSEISEINIELSPSKSESLLIIKPQTYMNDSGRAIQAFCSFYKIPSDKLLVIHDDLELSLGKIRTKLGGGSGGHNGLRSIDSTIGNMYWRLRFGINRPKERHMVSNYVIEHFTKDEQKIVESCLIIIDELLKIFIVDPLKNSDYFLNSYNKAISSY